MPMIGEREACWLAGIAWAMPPGCFVELGVYRGGSAWRLADVARKQRRALYLYDTFEGIPHQDDFDMHAIGDFADTSLDEVALAIPDAVIVKGVFPKSIVPMPSIAFCHVDADQYRSTKDACKVLGPKMAAGGVMVFDDYGQLDGATRAVDECFAGRVDQSGMRAAVRF